MQQPPNYPDWQQPQQPNTQYPPQQPSPPPQWQPQSPPPPNTYYPPPQWQQPPPKKKSRAWLWIVLGVLAVVVLGCIGVVALATSASKTTTSTIATTIATTASTPAPTSKASTPSGQQKWATVQTINGNGSKKTGTFSAPDDWKIVWSCAEQNIGGVTSEGVLTVSVYGSDNSIIDPAAVNATCKVGQAKTTGETEEHQGGNVYLDINGTGDWTIQIQELK